MCDKLREYLKDHLKKKLNIEIIDDDKGNYLIKFLFFKSSPVITYIKMF